MKDTAFGLLASGDLYIDFYDSDGNLTGFIGPDEVGNCKKFALKVETEKKENKLNGRDTLGQNGDAYTRISASTISLALNRYTSKMLAAAMMGTATDQTASEDSLSESITAIHDKWVEIGQENVSDVVVEDDSVTITADTLSATASDNSYNDSGNGFVTAGFQVGDTVQVSGFTTTANNIATGVLTSVAAGKIIVGGTDGDGIEDESAGDTVTITKIYVEDTDYEINERLGMIKALSTGDIADDSTLNLTGTIDAKTGSKITGSDQSVINVKLKLDGKDNVSGDDVQVTVYQAQLSSDTDFDLMAEDFPELTFTGTMVTPNGYTTPFEMI